MPLQARSPANHESAADAAADAAAAAGLLDWGKGLVERTGVVCLNRSGHFYGAYAAGRTLMEKDGVTLLDDDSRNVLVRERWGCVSAEAVAKRC